MEVKHLTENIRITTQDLKTAQEEWLAFADRAENAFLAAGDTAVKLEKCFSGQPVHRLKKDFIVIRNEGERCFGMLRKQLEKLSMIAIVYEEAEGGNISVATDN